MNRLFEEAWRHDELALESKLPSLFTRCETPSIITKRGTVIYEKRAGEETWYKSGKRTARMESITRESLILNLIEVLRYDLDAQVIELLPSGEKITPSDTWIAIAFHKLQTEGTQIKEADIPAFKELIDYLSAEIKMMDSVGYDFYDRNTKMAWLQGFNSSLNRCFPPTCNQPEKN